VVNLPQRQAEEAGTFYTPFKGQLSQCNRYVTKASTVKVNNWQSCGRYSSEAGLWLGPKTSSRSMTALAQKQKKQKQIDP